VQVWFPGYGWQNFDPTADVPLANPSPGSVLATTAGHALARLPWIPISLVLALVGAVTAIRRHRRRRPPTWAHRIAADLERGGVRLGRQRRTDETLSAYGRRLADADPRRGRQLIEATVLVERYTYGGIEPSAGQIATALAFTRRFRSIPRRGSAHPDPHDLDSAMASSKEAPAASSGR
jgi:transglutaminase-like putative cysteine protease